MADAVLGYLAEVGSATFAEIADYTGLSFAEALCVLTSLSNDRLLEVKTEWPFGCFRKRGRNETKSCEYILTRVGRRYACEFPLGFPIYRVME